MKAKRPVLAINGGPKSITFRQDDLHRWPRFGREEIAAATRVIRGGNLSYSPDSTLVVEEFKRIARVKYAVACTNGTAAGHCCFFAIDIRPGDEIIAPAFTYWATVLQALQLGGVPVFAEMDPKTLNLSPRDIEHRITKRTKAIVVVHMLGVPCEMGPIMRIAKRHGLKVIEDASHAHGAAWRGRPVGSFGDASFFSMQNSKVIPAGEGGIFCTNDVECYRRALALGHYMENKREGGEWSRFATGLGFKYRIHPIAAAIGRCQMRKMRRLDAIKKRNIERFHRGLRKLRLWDISEVPKHIRRVYYQDWQPWIPERAPGVTKERFIAALVAEGCDVRDARYNLLHQQTIFTDPRVYSKNGIFPQYAALPNKPIYRGDELPVSERHRQRLIMLPTFPGGTARHVDAYLRAFRKVEENLDELRG